MEEPEDSESDGDNGAWTEVDSVPPDSLDPSELKALFAMPPVRKDHLLVGFSALLAGL